MRWGRIVALGNRKSAGFAVLGANSFPSPLTRYARDRLGDKPDRVLKVGLALVRTTWRLNGWQEFDDFWLPTLHPFLRGFS